MDNGYIIQISGRNLNPKSFFKISTIQPDSIFKSSSNEGEEETTVIQFCDLHKESYPLDMLAEAIDFIKSNEDEFIELFKLPGIEEKSIYLYDSTKGGGLFLINKTQIKVLHNLDIELEISVI